MIRRALPYRLIGSLPSRAGVITLASSGGHEINSAPRAKVLVLVLVSVCERERTAMN